MKDTYQKNMHGKNINMKNISQKQFSYITLTPSFIFILLISIVPVIISIIMSFRLELLYNPDVSKWIGFRNFNDLFEDRRFWTSVKLTLLWSSVVVFIELLIGFVLALFLNKYEFLKNTIRTLLILPVFVSPIAMGLTWRYIFEPVSGLANWLINNFLGLEKIKWIASPDFALGTLMFVDIWQWTPFVTIVFLAGLQSLPKDIIEASKLDSIKGFYYIRYIVLPMLTPLLIVILLLRLVDSIKIFDIVFIMTAGGPGSSTLLASVYDYIIFNRGELGKMAAFGFLILFLVNILVFLFLYFFKKINSNQEKIKIYIK